MESLYDIANTAWVKRARRRCWSNSEWAEIERRRDSGHAATSIMISEERGLGTAELLRQHEIFAEMNPRPWWLTTLRALHESWRRVRNLPRTLRFMHQRVTRGFSDRDLWDLDGYLAGVIAGASEELRKVAHGHPVETTPEEWDAILRAIATGFAGYHDQRFEDFDAHLDALGNPESSYNRAWDLFRQYFPSLWE